MMIEWRANSESDDDKPGLEYLTPFTASGKMVRGRFLVYAPEYTDDNEVIVLTLERYERRPDLIHWSWYDNTLVDYDGDAEYVPDNMVEFWAPLPIVDMASMFDKNPSWISVERKVPEVNQRVRVAGIVRLSHNYWGTGAREAIYNDAGEFVQDGNWVVDNPVCWHPLLEIPSQLIPKSRRI